MLDILRAQDPFSCHRTNAAIGQGRRKHGHHLYVEFDGAGLEIELQCLKHIGVFGKRIVLSHVVAQCVISVGGAPFGLINRVVEVRFLISTKRGPTIQQIIETASKIEIRQRNLRLYRQ